MKASVLKLCPFRLSRLSSGPNMKGWRTYPRPLFEWRWADIAAECERYLAPNGFEDIVTNPVHPWWPEYQPISYKTCAPDQEKRTVDLMHVVNLILCVRDIYVDALCTYFNANTKEFPSIPFHRLGLNDAKCNTGSGNRELYDMNQVRNCRLVGSSGPGLGGKTTVDACKHMGLGDYHIIWRLGSILNNKILGRRLLTTTLPNS
uniref:Uncharacterized protein n=1 Tax=Astyanax mexicanus TaxID=7994 RepID=A0A3B1K577_ASTMX